MFCRTSTLACLILGALTTQLTLERATRADPQLAHSGGKDRLVQLARQAMTEAVAPYSHFQVGAAVIQSGKDRQPLVGHNNELLSICAERAALCGLKDHRHRVKEVVIASRTGVLPCGACLQALDEMGSSRTRVKALDTNGESREYSMAQLLPKKFPRATGKELEPHRELIASGCSAYQAMCKRATHGTRPPVVALVETDRGHCYRGITIKQPGVPVSSPLRSALEALIQDNALRGRNERVVRVAIVGRGKRGQGLPLPPGEDRQCLVDLIGKDLEVPVILYNPEKEIGAVIADGKELLPHPYAR